MQKKRGFTLIELLVVIAIIGILAAIVLVSVRKGPLKAKDAAIKSDLSQVRTQAVMIFDDTNSYADLCDAGNTLNDTSTDYPELATLETDVQKQQGGTLDLKCYGDDNSYCVSAKLNSGKYFCIDATGAPKETTDHCAGTTPYKCP